MNRDEHLRKCLNCDEPFTGRSDKKYCSELCRAVYNIDLKKKNLKIVNETNKVLLRNREILIMLNPEGKTTVRIADMERQGFIFRYFTEIIQTKTGSTYFFCYEYGYLYKDENNLLLVKKSEKQ